MQPPQELRIFRQLMDRLLPNLIEDVPFVEDEEDEDDYYDGDCLKILIGTLSSGDNGFIESVV